MTEVRMRAKYVAVNCATARGVAERWYDQYFTRHAGRWYDDRKQEIWKRLSALGENPDLAAVADIIGNKSWSYISCDGCSEYVERAASIGEWEPKNYCPTCLAEALTVLHDGAVRAVAVGIERVMR